MRILKNKFNNDRALKYTGTNWSDTIEFCPDSIMSPEGNLLIPDRNGGGLLPCNPGDYIFQDNKGGYAVILNRYIQNFGFEGKEEEKTLMTL